VYSSVTLARPVTASLGRHPNGPHTYAARVTPPATQHSLRSVLVSQGYRRLLAARLLSQAGDGAFQVGLASLFFFSPERAATTSALAWAFAASLIPYTVVGPFAGVLLDRWSRRQVLLGTNLVRTAMVAVVAGLVVQGELGPPLYVLVLACLSANRFFLAGLSAGLPHVVRPQDLVVANSITPTAGTVAALFGAAGGFGLRTVLGAGDGTDAVVLLCAAGAYLASAGSALRLGRDQLGPVGAAVTGPVLLQARTVARGLLDAAGHLRERRAALRALAVTGSLRVGVGLFTLTTVLLSRNTLSDPRDVDAGLTLVASAFAAAGAGAGLAALVTPVLARRLGLRTWVVGCLLAASAVEVVLALVLTPQVLVAGALVLGLAAQGVKIAVDTIVQTSVDDTYRGRVFTFYDTVFNAAFVLAALVAVLAVPSSGRAPAVFTGVAVLLSLTALAYRAGEPSAAPGVSGRTGPSPR